MTREQEAFEASKRFEISLTESYIESLSRSDMCFAFQLGIKWADSHPINHWISVEDDLPCNHEELLKAKYETKQVFILKPGGFPDVDYMLNINGEWTWATYKNSKFWMPIPELPKI